MEFETIILIPSFNGIALLKECIASIEQQSYKNFKTIVLDDKSTDKSVQFIGENFKNVEIIVNSENFGFAKSVNNGILYAIKKYNPKYITLLNNDTKADKSWLKELVTAIKSEDKIAGVASNMFFYDNPDIINCQGVTCDFLCSPKGINCGLSKKEEKNIKTQILSPSFGACILNTKYIDKIGFCDQRYSAYCEDLDWGIRANILGYKIIFEKKAIIYHKESSTYGKNNFRKVYFCRRNSLCTLIKNYEAKNMLLALVLTFLSYPFFSVYQFIKMFKKNVSIIEALKLSTIPFLAVVWNVYNIKETLRLRKAIQKNRKVKDNKIFNNLENIFLILNK